MRESVLYETYSHSREYKYEICRRRDGLYEVFVQKKHTDSDGYMPEGWFQYRDIADILHMADTLQRAIDIGDECLRNLE